MSKNNKWKGYKKYLSEFQIEDGKIYFFKLINGCFFHSYFHSFMYRVYIEGNHHFKNGKEWYKEITTNILISQLS